MNRPRLLPSVPLLLAACCLWSSLALADEAVDGDSIVTRGMKPWESCGECHDLDGVAPNGHFPSLAGQKPAYFLKQMEDFRTGRRANDHGQMSVAARDATGTKLDDVAAYFTGLAAPPPHPAAESTSAELERAQLLFAHGDRRIKVPACANCHAAEPRHDFIAPCLEAQQARYLGKQLDDFKSGRRTNDPQGVMQKIAQRLSEHDIAALSAYIASQPPPAAGVCTGNTRELSGKRG